ncbi:2-hydroxychromene-2-carboxylate isomerase [Comamonas fluminis]|uniref:2-hydroxychromene-2-carboxylate isomerase n=1 Tax=Comamonas fluminis TaxID=2796366 RepID=UPI001C4415A8|nr:2-hydroxychromene-2-carboxylate isomerase [Comamonas fluminis]
MKHITFYLDFVSPYAWLALEQIPQALQGISHHIEYRPVLLGALLQGDANPGPAGIPAKRTWTYRHVSWLGQSLGIPLQMPAQHPFNPLPLLRLALAHGRNGSINRFVAQAVMQHAWVGGLDANAPERLQVLRELLLEQKHAEEAGEDVKQWLRSNTDQAKQVGVFGVPAWEVDGKVFWGQDALPMLRSYLQGDAWFEPQWEAAAQVESGLKKS